MALRSLISNEIDQFYSRTSEEHRLSFGLGPLEYERSKELIMRYLPAQKTGIIVDVGGGPGIYSEWLAGLGYKVHLVDPVLKHIAQASRRSKKMSNPFSCMLGEAQRLDLQADIADMVILHGPLYHLQLEESRAKAIQEAKRVLKKGGIVLGFAINNAVSAITGLTHGFIHDADFFEMCRIELSSGFHDPSEKWPGLLPEGYFHQPGELQQEFEAAGLTCLGIIAVEGIIWLDKNYFESMGHPAKKERLLELLRLTETQSSLSGMSPHMMIAARK